MLPPHPLVELREGQGEERGGAGKEGRIGKKGDGEEKRTKERGKGAGREMDG